MNDGNNSVKTNPDLMGRESDRDGFSPRPIKNTTYPEELTLSYLCENGNNYHGSGKVEFNGYPLLSSLENNKGKEVMVENENNFFRGREDDENEEEKWIERDFLQLSNSGGGKRELAGEEFGREEKKKTKLDGELNLSLSLPDVSLSLNNDSQNNQTNHQNHQGQSQSQSQNQNLQCQVPVAVNGSMMMHRPSRSNQSMAPSKTGSSDDFTGAYSYSQNHSHNPSCSLTRNNSTEYYENSGSFRRDWNGGEGTNGSVHSRFMFRPVGDGVVFGHPVGIGNGKDSFNSLYRTMSGSDNQSLFPSELPARPMNDVKIERSEGGGSRVRKLSRPERIVREVVSESVPIMAQIFDEISSETIEATKEYLESLIGGMSEKKSEELVGLQNRLERRSDFTQELLSKCHKDQLCILVTIKTGLNYLMRKNQNRLPSTELIEIFLLLRCQNLNCKGLLPVDDCDCKICSTTKGFCSACMCPVCLKFDCASNTCSWVGCDVCSHWCHAICGIQKNLIRPGQSLRGPTGYKEMQFHCPGCDHASEMFGFVKDVFICCTKDWGLETLMKELDCVRKVFRGSEDFKGKQLQIIAEEMLLKLQGMLISPLSACNTILQFFKNGTSELNGISFSSRDGSSMTDHTSHRGVVVPTPPPSAYPPNSVSYNTGSSNVTRDKDDIRSSLSDRRRVESDWKYMVSKDGFDNLESMVRIKEAEARMFQIKADEARREAEGLRRKAHAKTENLEEEYTGKLAKLCLKETEERRKKRLEELKVLENSHCDYYNMKIRMQAEIASLLERMEATKQQWV